MSTVAHGLPEITALAGTDLGRTGWTEVTQERVNTFAGATGDHQWIHVDTARAAAVAAVEPVGDGQAVQLTADLTVEVDGGARPACVAQAIYRYYA